MDEWQPMETAPKGAVIECQWPGYNPYIPLHTGLCVYKRGWYPLGNKFLEEWWTVDGGPTAKPPIRWRPVP